MTVPRRMSWRWSLGPPPSPSTRPRPDPVLSASRGLLLCGAACDRVCIAASPTLAAGATLITRLREHVLLPFSSCGFRAESLLVPPVGRIAVLLSASGEIVSQSYILHDQFLSWCLRARGPCWQAASIPFLGSQPSTRLTRVA